MIFGNKIDKLVKEQERLTIKKQQILDKKDSNCSKLGVKRKKHEDEIQRLENRAYVLGNIAKAQISEINRRLKKNKQQIKLEQEYYFSLTDEEKKGSK